jgi:hypothetical protein
MIISSKYVSEQKVYKVSHPDFDEVLWSGKLDSEGKVTSSATLISRTCPMVTFVEDGPFEGATEKLLRRIDEHIDNHDNRMKGKVYNQNHESNTR